MCEELQPHDGKGVVDDEDEEEHTQEMRDKIYHGVHDVTIPTLHSDQSVQRERVFKENPLVKIIMTFPYILY